MSPIELSWTAKKTFKWLEPVYPIPNNYIWLLSNPVKSPSFNSLPPHLSKLQCRDSTSATPEKLKGKSSFKKEQSKRWRERFRKINFSIHALKASHYTREKEMFSNNHTDLLTSCDRKRLKYKFSWNLEHLFPDQGNFKLGPIGQWHTSDKGVLNNYIDFGLKGTFHRRRRCSYTHHLLLQPS